MIIQRTKERIKQTGEIFTPLSLVDEILSKLPPEVWNDPSKTFLDNSCGDGNFLVRVVAWKIHNGSTPEQALKTTYGVELMSDNVERCRKRLLIHAFAASVEKQFLLPHLTEDEEEQISLTKQCQQFVKKYKHIVEKNIVCHDALTYDYSFGEEVSEEAKFSQFFV